MAEQNARKRKFFSSLQAKYAMSYLVIFAVILVLMNTYPVIVSQKLLVSSKRESLKNQAAVMSSALMELEVLDTDEVVRVMHMLDSGGLSRILVTDPAGVILYDSETDGWTAGEPDNREEKPEYRCALYHEVVAALEGNDVFFSRYENSVLTSTTACPILYRGMIIGSIYLLEVDETQGALLSGLQQNLRTISAAIAAITLLVSALFSKMLTSRIGALLRAIRIVGEGEYGHRLQTAGRDELDQLADEFNALTDRLQTTEEVRRRFVSDASHELKTPLASIRLLADSILQNEEMDRETVQEFVSDIGSEADRLTRIAEHLLALTRLDSLPTGVTEPVDVSAVTGRAVNMLTPVADAAGVTLETALKPDCWVRCVGDECYQVCFNLIENAVKYNFPGGKVHVSVYPEKDQVLLEVSDTGVGIPEEDLPKIFNRFYRVDKARSRAAGGTGLGLSIVRDTVRRYGGWITAKNRGSGGSVFTAGFPRLRTEEKRGEQR